MSTIQIEHLTFSYPAGLEPIFSDVTLYLDTDWKLGFVGRNGRGKTTLLQLLLGRYEYSGRISAKTAFAYFPAPVAEPARPTAEILAESCPEAEPWEFRRELDALGVAPEAYERPFASLSKGEQTKVLLAALFLRRGCFFLIDEPTNHLDAETRAQVAAYLRRKRGFILVSHDRRFLDGCVDHILSLNRADIQLHSGDFSTWLENFQRQQAFEQAQNDRLEQDIARLRQASRRAGQWSDRVEASKVGAADKGYVGHKAAKMMRRAKSAEARQQRAAEEKAALLRNVEKAEPLKLTPLDWHSAVLASFDRAAARYDGRAAGHPATFSICRGDRIALTGRNGSGKSSLLRCLLARDTDHTGTVTVGAGLVISHVPQDAAGLRGTLADLARESRIDESRLKTILRKMDFSRVQLEQDMASLSAGQRKKVLLARSLCQQAHLYVWDEPLNYVDLYTRLQLERLLPSCGATMLFVEHDAAFCDAVATKRVAL